MCSGGRMKSYALSLVALLAFLSCAPVCQARDFELVIAHVNDTHSHAAGTDRYGNAVYDQKTSAGGAARLAAAMKAAKEENTHVLALDGGDQVQGSLFHSVLGLSFQEGLNALLPLDAMTFGNHEFDAGCAALASHVRANPVPMLAANLVPERDCPLASAGIAPFRIFAFEGRRVAVVGLANDEVRVIARACPHTRFAGAEKSLRDAVERLQGEGIDIIIGLSHLGLERDIELARAVQGLDIIVGGHTHSYLGPKVDGAPESEGPYPLVEHGPDGKTVLVVTAYWATRYLGLLRVSFDEAGVPVAWSGGPMELGPDLPRDERVARYVAQAAEKVESCRKVSLGHSDLVFADGLDACRAGDCLAGLVTTDAMLDYARPYGADITLYNGGGFRAGIPLGRVSLGSVLDILPFGNRLFLRTYKGAQVLAALEHGVAGSHARGPTILQCAGLAYSVDPQGEPGHRVSDVLVLDRNGVFHPLEDDKDYSVVLPEYLAQGGDHFHMLAKGKALPFPDPLDADVVADYLRARGELPRPLAPRIRFLR